MPLSGPCGASRGRRLGPADGADRRGLGAEGVPGSAARPRRHAHRAVQPRPARLRQGLNRRRHVARKNWCHIPVTSRSISASNRLSAFRGSISVRPIDGTVHLGTSPSPPELVGRAQECRALEELVDAVRTGQSRVLVVRVMPASARARCCSTSMDAAAGFKVLHATGVESEMELPFAALHQLCAPLLDRLDALPDPQRDAASTAFGLTRRNAGSTVDRARGLEPAVGGVRRRARCSVSSTMRSGSTASRPRRSRSSRGGCWPIAVGLVFATRQPSADLAAFRELVVEGLHDADAQTLLGAVLHVPLDERVRDRIVAETHGNPLALMEWPRGLSRAELAGGFGMPASLSITGQIEESFRRRIAELPPATQRFLTVAAAEPTGDPVIVWRAAGGLGVDPQEAAPAIDAGLVEIGVRVWFRHPLVRSAAYGSAALDGTAGCASGARRGDRSGSRSRSARVASRARLARARRRHRRGARTIGRPRSCARWTGRRGGVARALGGGRRWTRRDGASASSPRPRPIWKRDRSSSPPGCWPRPRRRRSTRWVAPRSTCSRARLAVFGGDARAAPELLLRAAKRSGADRRSSSRRPSICRPSPLPPCSGA